MSTMKVNIGQSFPQQKNVSACLRRYMYFYNLNTQQVSAAGQAKTRSVTILISGKVPTRGLHSVVLCIPGIYTRVSFGLGPAWSRNNEYDWVFLGKNYTDNSR